jgi:threonine dehydrogenase-like Zn-dependent dehydrogenase
MGRARVTHAAVLVAPETIELHEFERPAVPEDGAILRVEACGLCGTDIAQWHGFFLRSGLSGERCIPGHEPVGVIDEVGPVAAARWRVAAGDRVAVEPHLSCGVCPACLAGQRTACDAGEHREANYGFISAEHGSGLWGGYAEHLQLDPRSVLHRISPRLPASLASMFNPIGAGISWGSRVPSTRIGDLVVVLGSGQRGLACVIAARAAGAATVIVTDLARAAAKLDLARELGADHAIVADEENVIERVAQLTGGRLADIVIDVSAGATQPILDAIEIVRPGGTIVLAGAKDGQPLVGLLPDRLVLKSIRMQGAFAVDSASFREAIRLLELGTGPYARLHTKSFALADAEAAIARLEGTDGDPPALHVAIEPGIDS